MNRRNFLMNAFTFAAAPAAMRAMGTPLSGISQTNPFLGLSPERAMALEESNLAKTTTEIDSLLASGPFQPNWNSLHAHQDADWFRDAKFGIYSPLGSGDRGQLLLARRRRVVRTRCTRRTTRHSSTTRRPSEYQHTIGYKNIIPRFTGERFDAHRWADIVARSGAKFAGPVAIHHDNFALWNSSLTRWNSVAMGPRRDIVGELAQAYRARGLRFITSFHHGFAWRYYEPSFA